MPFIWVLNGKRIKKFVFILVTAFFAAFVAFVQNQQIAVLSTPVKSEAIASVNTTKPHVALTFDLSSGDIQIEPLLKILKKQNVRATFFISGQWANAHKEMVKDLKKNGFEIESNGQSEEQTYPSLKAEDIHSDLVRANQMIKNAGGGTPHFVRPPKGKANEMALQETKKVGQQMVLWDVDPQDYTNPGYESIVSYVLENTEKGSIIRLNATDTANQTVRALPLILKGLEEKGLTIVPLSTLITDSKTKTKLVN